MINLHQLHSSKSALIKIPLLYSSTFDEFYLSVCLSEIREKGGESLFKNTFSTVEMDLADDFTEKEVLVKQSVKEDEQHKLGLNKECKYCLSINYPITIQNCLPQPLNLQFCINNTTANQSSNNFHMDTSEPLNSEIDQIIPDAKKISTPVNLTLNVNENINADIQS